MRQRSVDVSIIGVPNASEGTTADKQAFIDAMSTQIPHVLDDPGELWREFGVTSQPTMVFVAADGSFERRTGALGATALLERLREFGET